MTLNDAQLQNDVKQFMVTIVAVGWKLSIDDCCLVGQDFGCFCPSEGGGCTGHAGQGVELKIIN